MAPGPITSWQIERKEVGAVKDFIFLGSKITGNDDCSYEIKRCLLLGSKAMWNLDSILKSRDITLLTKVYIDKTVVFLVVMYRCESWTIKKAKHWRTDPFKLCCWRKLLRDQESKPVKIKEVNPEYSLEGPRLKLKLQYFDNLMWRADSLENTLMLGKTEGMRRRWGAEDEMIGWHHWLNGHEFEQALGDSEGQWSLACCSPWGHRAGHGWVTEQHPLHGMCLHS